MEQRILIIEDNVVINRSIEEVLIKEGFIVHVALDGEKGLWSFHSNLYDLILLDLNLPDIRGEEILKRIRSKSDVPVIIISINNTEIDKAVYLGLGADDYITKPISLIETAARVKAMLRRTKSHEDKADEELKVGDLTIKLGSFEVYKKDKLVALTAKEFQIFKLLVQHPNQTFSKEDIYRIVWQEDLYNDNLLNVHIRRLRSKIEDNASEPQYIKTHWGFGYKLGNFN